MIKRIKNDFYKNKTNRLEKGYCYVKIIIIAFLFGLNKNGKENLFEKMSYM